MSDNYQASLDECAKSIWGLHTCGTFAVLKTAKYLKEAQHVLAKAGCEGRFKEWVEESCPFSRRTAYNYLQVEDVFGNCATVAQFELSALIALSKKSTPKEAIEEAIKETKEGYFVTGKRAKEIIESHKPQEPAVDDLSADQLEWVSVELADIGKRSQDVLEFVLNTGVARTSDTWKLAMAMHRAQRAFADHIRNHAKSVADNEEDVDADDQIGDEEMTVGEAADILGVSVLCSAEELMEAYRRRSKECHPDCGGSHEEFVRLGKAFEILQKMAGVAA